MPAGSSFTPQRGHAAQGGFTYVSVMAVVALLGIGLAAIGPLWAEDAQREREQELLRLGELYAQAIGEYVRASPGSLKRHPQRLEDLVLDTRYVGTKRHIRKLYADPLQPARPWGLVRAADGGIRGVFSQDPRLPFARAPMELAATRLPAAGQYSDWVFAPKDQP